MMHPEERRKNKQMLETEQTDDLSTWTDAMLVARRNQLMNDAYKEIQEHNDKLTAINIELAKIGEEERNRKP